MAHNRCTSLHKGTEDDPDIWIDHHSGTAQGNGEEASSSEIGGSGELRWLEEPEGVSILAAAPSSDGSNIRSIITPPCIAMVNSGGVSATTELLSCCG